MKKLTILIPFKNREDNLKVFIPYFNNFMKTNFSEIQYKIVVIEQGNDKPFNKGILFNAGFFLTKNKTDYYALHDIDQLPISADYSYSEEPNHICVNCIEQSKDGVFKNPYQIDGYQQKGGSIIISKKLYSLSNGHSNNYWGWGGIDDDFAFRLESIGHPLLRYRKKFKSHTLENNEKGYFLTLNAYTKRFWEDENYIKNFNYGTDVFNGKINPKLEGLNTTEFKIIDKKIYNNYIKYIIDFEINPY